MKNINVGFALCGSYCTFDTALEALAALCEKHTEVIPIMTEKAFSTDSRFGKAADFNSRIEAMTGKKIISTISQAEPIGPNALLDILVIAPCTGNTLAKLANGITDSSVTMAAKAHLRNGRPLLIALSTNDALSANAQNIGVLLARKHVYFVPFYQDDPTQKPASLVAELKKLPAAIDAALRGEQLQPVLLGAAI